MIEGLIFHGSFQPEDLDHVVPLVEQLLEQGNSRILLNLADVPSICPAAAIFLGAAAARCREAGGELVFAAPPAILLPALTADEDLATVRTFATEAEALAHFGIDPGEGPGFAGVPVRLRPR